MDDHAKTVAARWADKRSAAIAEGMKPAAFDDHMLRFLRWGGWNEADAQAIVTRARKLSERREAECEQS
jgi:hypothetical protein